MSNTESKLSIGGMLGMLDEVQAGFFVHSCQVMTCATIRKKNSHWDPLKQLRLMKFQSLLGGLCRAIAVQQHIDHNHCRVSGLRRPI